MSLSDIVTEIEKCVAFTDRVKKRKQCYLDATPHLSAARSRLVTLAHKETEGEPLDIRRAKMFARIMEELPIHIEENELIVGFQSEYLRGASPAVDFDPEYTFQILSAETLTLNAGRDAVGSKKAVISDEEKKSLLEDAQYWKGKSPADAIRRTQRDIFGSLMDDTVEARLHFGFDQRPMTSRYVDFEKVINKKGLLGVIAEAEEELKKAKEGQFHGQESLDKFYFLRAVIIACESVITFARRYSELAKKMAESEKDSRRKAELQKISEVCLRVPAHPARTLHEAVQSFWFVHLCNNLEHCYNNETPGRMDQYLFPRYRHDVDNNIITRSEAAELLGCLWVKFVEMEVAKGKMNREHIQGNMGFDVVIGGVKSDGTDATNELTFMILEVSKQVKTVQPLLYLRTHKDSPDELWMKAVEVNSERGDGQPAFLNDAAVILNFEKKGIPLPDARNFLVGGCIHPYVNTGNPDRLAHPNISKMFEMTLNNGFDPRTKKQIGPKTGDPREFKSFDELYNAFKEQVAYFVNLFATCHRVYWQIRNKHYSFPFSSALMDDCIKNGKDQFRGGLRYPQLQWGMQDRGMQNAVNSLVAIKKVVFDTKEATMAEVLDALEVNFEGKEELRNKLLKAPKYGNDDDYVDDIFNDWSLWIQNRIAQEKTNLGTPMRSGRGGATIHMAYGKVIGALPDGRKAGVPLADGSLSPMRGTDLNGPTAIIKSATKANHTELATDTLLNMKLPTAVLATKDAKAKLIALMKTLFQRGGYQVQFNVLDNKILEEAIKNPEEHRNLMVRVAGYSAYFVDLDPKVQQEIMERTEYNLA